MGLRPSRYEFREDTVQFLAPYNAISFNNKKNRLPVHTSMWVNLKIIMLNKRSQTEDYTPCDSIYITFYKRQNCRDRKPLSSCQGLGIGEGDLLQRSKREFFWSDGTVLYLDNGHGYPTEGIYHNLSNCTV